MITVPSKKNKFRSVVITTSALVISGSILYAPQTRAGLLGGLSGFADIFSAWAPMLSDVFKIDLSTYVDKVNFGSSIVSAIDSNDWKGVLMMAPDAIGEFGLIDKNKWIKNAISTSDAKFEAFPDYASSKYTARFDATLESEELLARLNQSALTSDQAQQAQSDKLSATSTVVKGIGTTAESIGKTNNSLTALKGIGNLLGANGVLTAQQIYAEKENGKHLTEIRGLLTNLVSLEAQDVRVKRRSADSSSYYGIGKVGRYLGIIEGPSVEEKIQTPEFNRVLNSSEGSNSYTPGSDQKSLPEVIPSPKVDSTDSTNSSLADLGITLVPVQSQPETIDGLTPNQ